jgi:hypothetical protein
MLEHLINYFKVIEPFCYIMLGIIFIPPIVVFIHELGHLFFTILLIKKGTITVCLGKVQDNYIYEPFTINIGRVEFKIFFREYFLSFFQKVLV